jgi:hypothetical protein
MRRCAGSHGFSAAAKSLAVVVMAAATLAQFWELSHEVTVRHFRCAEHGELTHVAPRARTATTVSDLPPSGARRIGDVLRAQVVETVDAHEHCATIFSVEGSGCAPVVRAPTRYTPPPSVPRATPAVTPCLGRAFVLASAPKTSPPSA